MYHSFFVEGETNPRSCRAVLLIRAGAMKKSELLQHYVRPLQSQGVDTSDLMAFSLQYNDNNKAPVSLQREYLAKLLPKFNEWGLHTLYVCDAAYFKTLTKQTKAEPHYGYKLPCAIPDYEHFNVVMGVNYNALIKKPDLQPKLDLTLKALADVLNNRYNDIGQDIIHGAQYPTEPADISDALNQLLTQPMLTCDIEAYSLKFWDAGIGTIAFATDQHHGVAFSVDFNRGKHERKQVRDLVRRFFEQYQGTLVFHNASYDVKVLIYQLWMTHLQDWNGLRRGLNIMTAPGKLHDTKLITYLATNSCAGNHLGLKEQSHEFAGNYAEDVKDITALPEPRLLEYNLVDCLSTWYVYHKHWDTVLRDQQRRVYDDIFIPSVRYILQMELVGMPVDMDRTRQVESELETLKSAFQLRVMQSNPVTSFNTKLRKYLSDKDYDKRLANSKTGKIKPTDPAKYANEVFNPGSRPQLQMLLFEHLGLPVLELTDSGQPATGAEVLIKLQHHTRDSHVLDFLDALKSLLEVDKIIGTFIKAIINNSVLKPDGWYYLHGSFNLGGTKSGRLSSSEPNLQNLPSGSTYAKQIKSCFRAKKGQLFGGADFASLEDRISALQTGDRNKLKVYLDGYDGHSLRAYSYWPHLMPDIDPTSVESINSIKDKYDALRSKSKGPTFLLTYGGTYHGLMGLGFSEQEAKDIERRYHELYVESDEWVHNRVMNTAPSTGYVVCAFGLRLRTPMLKQSLMQSKYTPHEAKGEARTAGNALGQSYGLLNNRASIELHQRIWSSKYWNRVFLVSNIHDAIYLMFDDDPELVTWLNQNIVECMEWQELEDIQHDRVKLGAELDIFWPNWSNGITLPNRISEQQVRETCKRGIQKYKAKLAKQKAT